MAHVSAPKRRPLPDCPRRELHTGGQPTGIPAWNAWAEEMSKTHRQRKCPGCDRYQIWEPKPTPAGDLALIPREDA